MEVYGEQELFVKENRIILLPLTARWLLLGLAWSACALLLVARIDVALPEPHTRETANPEQFVAEIAYEHLVNLTSIGPRVAGSYENEVLSVAILVSAVKSIASQASPHNRVELDVQRASGSFSLTFMDGMNNVYRDVQSVVARVSGAGARAGGRTALLLNCHFDTVPDSPGASDDGAGCAVLLETMRALAASPYPLRHDAIFLFNGAEENILQASHAFITQHKWAKSVRAFINLEACGAGGREVLFQAGPHDPWIMEVYAGAVPHPFASSLAQEIFESGLIPADTDFRIFRDFGKLSGVDLAWSSNGYVYHTRLDTAAHVPRAALQRTGDNVLALARGLLSSTSLESEVDESSRQPVFFDVLGLLVLSARAPAALALVAATLALVALKLHLNAADANKHLYMGRGAWLRAAGRGAGAALGACAGGVGAAGGVAALLHAAGVRLAFYARPALLAPLYVAPALAASWALLARGAGGGGGGGAGGALGRGWWRARAAHDAQALVAGGALAACALLGLRSGFLPLLWALLPSAADVLARLVRAPRPLLWAAGAALPLLQTCYLLLNSLYMFVPIMGRAGSGPVPPDVMMAVMTSALMLAALSWLLPFVVATRNPHKLVYWLWAACALGVAAATWAGAGGAYSATRPQRLMLFHTRRTLHGPPGPPGHDRVDNMFWVPELDPNTRQTLERYVAGGGRVSPAACGAHVYCGAPYYLPVLSRVARAHRLPAATGPLVQLRAQLRADRVAPDLRLLHVNVTRAAQHVVLIVSPPPGATLEWSSVLEAPLPSTPWGERQTYFLTLHAARAGEGGAQWDVRLRVRGERGEGDTRLSLAAHAMAGALAVSEEQAALAGALPPHVAATGWGVDLHLYSL